MRTNTARPSKRTHEGARAKRLTPEIDLRRSVMACLLWENQFYEDGVSIAERIANGVDRVDGYTAAKIASEARNEMKLRHAPLLIVAAMDRLKSHKPYVAGTLYDVIHRPDELAEYASIAMMLGGRKAVSASKQARRGLAWAFEKFDEYQLAKWDNQRAAIKLRDVLFLSHAKPKDEKQADLWKRLAEGRLQTPDTWETALSGGGDKQAEFERLIHENKLGAMALLRNLRNMEQAGVERSLVKNAITKMNPSRVLPFRFIAAARHAPTYEPELNQAMLRGLENMDRLPGETVVLVDHSGSMAGRLSRKSDMNRFDAACGVAIVAREMFESVRVFSFSNETVEVPPRRGFALRDAIIQSQQTGGTYLGGAVRTVNALNPDRIVAFTDEQSHDRVPDPKSDRAYMINVASYQNGIGYGPWTHIDGFSESVMRYIAETEQALG